MATENTNTLGQKPVRPPTRDLAGLGGLKKRAQRPQPVGEDPATTPPTTGEEIEAPTGPTRKKSAARKRAPQKATQAAAAPAADQDQPEKNPVETPAPAVETAAPKASAAGDASLTRGRVLYLTDEDRDALALACTRQRRTRTEVVLDAIEATYEQLGGLVEEDLQPKVVPGRLWDSVVKPNRRDQPPKRQVFITPTIQQLEVIDQLVQTVGARDRSHLVSVALREHLA